MILGLLALSLRRRIHDLKLHHHHIRRLFSRMIWMLGLLSLSACTAVDLDAPPPVFDTGINPESWAKVPAGEFLYGQHDEIVRLDYDYEIMITDVTVAQYIEFLNAALKEGKVSIAEDAVTGFYPGDPFHGIKHEIRIDPAEYLFVPLNDPASRFIFTNGQFSVKPGWENHPMTNVSWFGAWSYCGFYEGRLPLETEWEKAARGADGRPYPWGWTLALHNANYYASRDPFEDMRSFGSRTTPVGFYNGSTYDGYATLDSASPYGLYDMAGNVWQWLGDVQPQEGFSDRWMHGGSKDTYDMDLRIWVRNSAPPMYYSPGVGFRCVREPVE
ncbi:MAG: formylglycine-generating enzyme family protein [Chloroflexota bacterium]